MNNKNKKEKEGSEVDMVYMCKMTYWYVNIVITIFCEKNLF